MFVCIHSNAIVVVIENWFSTFSSLVFISQLKFIFQKHLFAVLAFPLPRLTACSDLHMHMPRPSWKRLLPLYYTHTKGHPKSLTTRELCKTLSATLEFKIFKKIKKQRKKSCLQMKTPDSGTRPQVLRTQSTDSDDKRRRHSAFKNHCYCTHSNVHAHTVFFSFEGAVQFSCGFWLKTGTTTWVAREKWNWKVVHFLAPKPPSQLKMVENRTFKNGCITNDRRTMWSKKGKNMNEKIFLSFSNSTISSPERDPLLTFTANSPTRVLMAIWFASDDAEWWIIRCSTTVCTVFFFLSSSFLFPPRTLAYKEFKSAVALASGQVTGKVVNFLKDEEAIKKGRKAMFNLFVW